MAEEGEAGLLGSVVEYCDYGNIRFARVEGAGQEFLIKADPSMDAEHVRIAIDSGDVSVYSTRIDMKIC